MSFFKPKFVLLALVGTLLPAIWTSGCSGSPFTAGDGATAGATSTGGSSSGAGTGTPGSGGDGVSDNVSCDGPEDCDDKNLCTIDRCNADGTCDASPKCGGADKCCSGDCQQCCEHSDCEDDLACTDNTCFMGQCMFVPQDQACAATEYCSAKSGCTPRQVCTGLPGESAAVCDDQAGCTTDVCEGGFCQHKFCDTKSAAKLCCEGTGCAECCTDSQCDDGSDPCTVGSCQDGKCSVSGVPLCGKGQECCPSADGTTATCGACCSANDCDDAVGCTVDQCVGGQCSHTPDVKICGGEGYVCDLTRGCMKAPACTVNTDCKPTACQSNGRCEGGACHFDGCTLGTTCCANGSGCAACCSDAGCNDNIACTKDACGSTGCTHTPDSTQCPPRYLCKALNGCVPGCMVDDDCKPHVTTNAAIPIGTNPCSVSKCVQGQCQDTTIDCGDFQTCCPATGGCTLPNQCL